MIKCSEIQHPDMSALIALAPLHTKFENIISEMASKDQSLSLQDRHIGPKDLQHIVVRLMFLSSHVYGRVSIHDGLILMEKKVFK